MVLLEFFAPLHFYDHTLYDRYVHERKGKGDGSRGLAQAITLIRTLFWSHLQETQETQETQEAQIFSQS